eukprot:scpid110500/ scgid27529/ Zinc finger BED domain-containing protein 1; Putative Ac-like transposable element; dREF homolog
MEFAIRHTLDMPAISKLLAQCRKPVGHTNHSNVASHTLREHQVQESVSRTLTLVSEVATRWNYTCDILARLVKLCEPIAGVLNDTSITKASDQSPNLDTDKWKQAEALTELFEPFKAATTSLSTSSKVSISTVQPVMFGLRCSAP